MNLRSPYRAFAKSPEQLHGPTLSDLHASDLGCAVPPVVGDIRRTLISTRHKTSIEHMVYPLTARRSNLDDCPRTTSTNVAAGLTTRVGRRARKAAVPYGHARSLIRVTTPPKEP